MMLPSSMLSCPFEIKGSFQAETRVKPGLVCGHRKVHKDISNNCIPF